MKSNVAILTILAFLFSIALVTCGGSANAPVTEPTPAPSQPTQVPDKPEGDPIADGKRAYGSSCAACHGDDAAGIEGIGKDIISGPFTKGLGDDELLTFIKVGRGPGDPDNTTGVGMPPKGGNPSLSDTDLKAIIAYLRSIEK